MTSVVISLTKKLMMSLIRTDWFFTYIAISTSQIYSSLSIFPPRVLLYFRDMVFYIRSPLIAEASSNICISERAKQETLPCFNAHLFKLE